MSDFSCFAVYRSIQLISKEVLKISELRDGNLLLLVKDEKISEKFLKSSQLPGICQIKCSLHEQLNTTKDTVFAPYLNKVPEEEIVNELKNQGVSAAFKFNKFVDGKALPSGVILLSFNLYNLPSKIDISWHSVKVRQYIPNPMRCKSCQLLGHTAKWCKNSPMCVKSYLPPHSPKDCTRLYCANCAENHSAAALDCKKYLQQKEILTIKTNNKCTMQEAKQIHRLQVPGSISAASTSYANIAANRNTTISTNSHNNSLSSVPTDKQTNLNNNTVPSQSTVKKNLTQKDQPLTETNNITPSLSVSESNTINKTTIDSTYSPPLTRKKAKAKLSRSLSNASLFSDSSLDLTSNEKMFLEEKSSSSLNLSLSNSNLPSHALSSSSLQNGNVNIADADVEL